MSHGDHVMKKSIPHRNFLARARRDISTIGSASIGSAIIGLAFLVLAGVTSLQTAQAADVSGARTVATAPPAFTWRPELRLGLMYPELNGPERGSPVVGMELIVSPFHAHFGGNPPWYIPRVHAGFMAHTGGKTSYVYSGFTWTYDITPRLFVEGALGFAGHNGETGNNPAPTKARMGCNFAFREAASVGYRLSRSWSALLSVEHVSNADLCKQNRGLTNFGIRLGYQF